ncbi:MAG: hypothetical protein U0869_14035 [Chloroflexota bacterium]
MNDRAAAELVLTRADDRLALIRLAVAVRAAYDRSAMIYADADLAIWVRRWMAEHGRRLTVEVLPDGGLRCSEGDPDAWAAVRRAAATGSFT